MQTTMNIVIRFVVCLVSGFHSRSRTVSEMDGGRLTNAPGSRGMGGRDVLQEAHRYKLGDNKHGSLLLQEVYKLQEGSAALHLTISGLLLGCFWAALILLQGCCGKCWAAIGRFLAASGLLLGCSYAAPGLLWQVLGCSWPLLGCFWAAAGLLLCYSRAAVGSAGLLLATSWLLLGCCWAALRLIQGSCGLFMACSWLAPGPQTHLTLPRCKFIDPLHSLDPLPVYQTLFPKPFFITPGVRHPFPETLLYYSLCAKPFSQ